MRLNILIEMNSSPDLFIWFGSPVVGLIFLWLMESDKPKATILILITILPALLAGPLFLLMVLGKAFFGAGSYNATKVKQG